MLAKYQIFISSTYEDLKEERERVIRAILEMGHIPVGMEMFNAANESQWNIIKRRIDESDYYLVIVANRYGSIDEKGLSYTEKEYDYATAQGVPAIGFPLDDTALWPTDHGDRDPSQRSALDAFKRKLKTRLVKSWKTKDDLAANIVLALTPLMTEHPRPGWVRGSEVPSTEVLNELSRLSKENAYLRDELAKRSEEQNLIQVIKLLRERTISVTFFDNSQTQMTLLSFFAKIGRDLILELGTGAAATEFGPKLSGGVNKRLDDQALIELLKDLSVFDLVESRRKAASETRMPFGTLLGNSFSWKLTAFGKAALVRIESSETNGRFAGG